VSPRAASRLESIGFTRVYDYTAGKADWGSYGLPLDGTADSSTRVSSITAADVPRCRLDEAVTEVAVRLPADWDMCVVVNEHEVVLGLLGRKTLASDEPAIVEDVMTPAPSTIRPSARIEAIRKRMRDQNLTRIIVSRSDGTLLGVVRREDLGVGA